MALRIGLHPRPFNVIEAERQDLQYRLDQRDRLTRELFRDHRRLVELSKPGHTRGLNQYQRDRAVLEKRIAGAIEHEMALLTRLGELHVEIQCRDRGYMVQNEWTTPFNSQNHTTAWGSAYQGQPMAPPEASFGMCNSCDGVSLSSGERPYADDSDPPAYGGAEPQQDELSAGSLDRADPAMPVECPEGRWQLQSPKPRQQRHSVPALCFIWEGDEHDK